MKSLTAVVAGFAVLALTGGAAVAHDKMAMGHMNMKMSKMDMRTMKSCQAMSHDAMMKAAKCKKMMARHADMMNSDGSMKDMTPH